MGIAEIDTAQRIEQPEIPDEIRELLEETGFDLEGMSPEEINEIVREFKKNMGQFHSIARRILRGEVEEEVA
jgi:hypothetical protein